MKLSIICPECSDAVPFSTVLEPTNDAIYDLKCPNGHEFKFDLLCHHFNLLFENGVNAIVDGYYIEAVSSFWSSMERFMELFTRVALEARGIVSERFEETWKLVASQSERQLGAFILIYLMEFDAKPPILKRQNIEFRNRMIHKGHFPSKDEFVDFGNAVLRFIIASVETLHQSEIHRPALLRSVNDTGVFDTPDIRIHLYHFPMISGFNHPLDLNEGLTVEKLVERTKKSRDLL